MVHKVAMIYQRNLLEIDMEEKGDSVRYGPQLIW